LSPFEAAVEISDKTIRYDWLNIQINDPIDNVRYSKGGIKLTKFENDGIFQSNEVENIVIFKSRATFFFEINAYTDVDIHDVWPEIDTNKQEYSRFLWFRHYVIWPFVPTTNSYGVTWRTIDFGPPETFNPNDFDLIQPISVDIAPDFADLDGQILNGIPIKSADFIYHVKSMEVVSVRDGTCGDYKDIYTDRDFKAANVDFDQFMEQAPTNHEALRRVESYGLGVVPGPIRDKVQIQQRKADTRIVTDIEINPISNAPLIFNEMIVLRPEITKSVEEFAVKDCAFEYAANTGTSTVFTGPLTHEKDRIRSVHIYNQFIHKEYKVEVVFLSTVQLDAEMYESFLGDPYLKMGDWLWDEEIGGVSDVVVVANQPITTQLIEGFMAQLGDLFGLGGILTWIIVIIVAIVGIYIFIKIGIPLIRLRTSRKQKKVDAPRPKN
jgi:hypothetical protein